MTDEATQIQRNLSTRITGALQLVPRRRPGAQSDVTPFFNNPTGRSGILSLNAHYNHWELAPALPQPIVQSGLVNSAIFPAGTTGAQLQNAILFTMGCHGGLNVSDTFPASTDKQQQLRDWAQALAQNGAGVYVANTGYGYGDYDAIALSEQLMTMFAHNLALRRHHRPQAHARETAVLRHGRHCGPVRSEGACRRPRSTACLSTRSEAAPSRRTRPPLRPARKPASPMSRSRPSRGRPPSERA